MYPAQLNMNNNYKLVKMLVYDVKIKNAVLKFLSVFIINNSLFVVKTKIKPKFTRSFKEASNVKDERCILIYKFRFLIYSIYLLWE